MLVKLLIAIFAVYNLSAEAPTASRSPKLSFPAKASERTILFYLCYPKMKFNAKGNLDLSMKTRVPSIAGSLYYGHFHPHQNFPVPRYRYHLKEKISPKGTEKALNHHFQIPFGGKSSKSPEKKKYDAPGVRHQGGVIPLRFEYYNPRKQASELFETSFRYYKNSTGKRSIEPHIIAGPYFDTPGAGQVSISFQMDRPIAGRVILRRKGAAKTQAYGFKASMHPEIHIEGLTEGGRYTYQVQIPNPDHGNGGSYYSYPETEIRVPGSDFKPFSFACMSDSRAGHGGGEFNIQGTNTRSIKKLMRAAYDRGADFIFFPGDLIDGYTTIKEDFEQQLMAWKKAVSPVHRRIPIFEGMGNHEALMKRYVVDREAPIQPLKYGSFSISDPENPPEEIFASHFVNPENGPKSEGFDSPPYGETVNSVV